MNTAEGEGVDPKPKAQGFKEKHALSYPILLDATGSVMKAYGVMGFPTNVLIDREGKVRYAEPGFNAAALDAALQGLLGNAP